MEEKVNAYKLLVDKLEVRRPFGRFRHRWEDIKLDLKELCWEDVECINLTQDRERWWILMNAYEGGNEICSTGSFWIVRKYCFLNNDSSELNYLCIHLIS